jgi:hypothetical protein
MLENPSRPVPIEIRGNWLILRTDALGKRAVAQCTMCGSARELSLEALDGGVNCPGCLSPRSAAPTKPAADSFATGVANLQSWGALKRHKGAVGS